MFERSWKICFIIKKRRYCVRKYIDSWEKLNEKLLPPKANLFSSPNNKRIFDRNYKHSQRVWNMFKMIEIGDYLILHNIQVVWTLLAVDIEFMTKASVKFNLIPLNFVAIVGNLL